MSEELTPESKAIINIKTGEKITNDDIKSKKPENVKALLVKSGAWIYEGDKVEVTTEVGAQVVEDEIKRLTAEREVFEAEKEAFAQEKAAFEAEKANESQVVEDENAGSAVEEAISDATTNGKTSGKVKK